MTKVQLPFLGLLSGSPLSWCPGTSTLISPFPQKAGPCPLCSTHCLDPDVDPSPAPTPLPPPFPPAPSCFLLFQVLQELITWAQVSLPCCPLVYSAASTLYTVLRVALINASSTLAEPSQRASPSLCLMSPLPGASSPDLQAVPQMHNVYS